ncbi:hypothetical protein, partial [Bacillus sp. mrc49]
YKSKRYIHRKSRAANIKEWLREVESGEINIFDMPAAVTSDYLSLLSYNFNDLLAASTLKQRVLGPPAEEIDDIMGRFPYRPDRYPYHGTSLAIEQPTGKPYNPIKDGYDYFYKQDINNGVDHYSLANYPETLTKTGTRSGTVKTSDGFKGVKNSVYK